METELNDVIDPSMAANFSQLQTFITSVLMGRFFPNYFTNGNSLPNSTCLLQFLIDPTTPLKTWADLDSVQNPAKSIIYNTTNEF